MKRLRYENGEIDPVDAKIIETLVKNARISVADLARLVRLSAPTVAERIKRLEEAGVIEGYTLSISPKALGLPVAAWIRIRPLPGNALASPARTASSRGLTLPRSMRWRS